MFRLHMLSVQLSIPSDDNQRMNPMHATLTQFSAQIGAFLGVVLAFAFVRNTVMSLWLATPVGIAIIYLTVLAVGFVIARARQ